jgi:hypothetical protein
MRIPSTRFVSNSLAIAVLCVTMVGVAFATIPDADGVIHGCYGKSNGQLRVEESSTNCKNNEIPLTWGFQGPPSDAFVAARTNSFFIPGGATQSASCRCPFPPAVSWSTPRSLYLGTRDVIFETQLSSRYR